MILSLWKGFVGSALILIYVVIASLFRLFLRDPWERRRFYHQLVGRVSRVYLAAIGFRLEVEGLENIRPGQSYLVVANHMSYLDALFLAAIRPMAFVTSVEMREAAFLGTLTELGGCLYVERRSKDNIQREIAELDQALRLGFNVAVFPEATSTDGTELRPFKRPMFQAAVSSGHSVLPLVIQYESIDGAPVTAANRDLLCWYGDMDFAPHFFALTRCREIVIRVKVLPEIPVDAGATRDTMMEAAYGAISRTYRPIPR